MAEDKKSFDAKLTDFIKANLSDLVSDEIREKLAEAHGYKKRCEAFEIKENKHYDLNTRNRTCASREEKCQEREDQIKIDMDYNNKREAELRAKQDLLHVERRCAKDEVDNMRSVLREVFTKQPDTANDGNDNKIEAFMQTPDHGHEVSGEHGRHSDQIERSFING